jgi:sugar lactone lactonase YvrE
LIAPGEAPTGSREGSIVKRSCLLIAGLASLATVAVPLGVSAHHSPIGVVQNFGPNLRPDCPSPEGIAVDPSGRLYATSIPLAPGAANICVLNPEGKLIDRISVAPGPGGFTNLAGELFVPDRGLYVADLADDFFVHPTAQNGRLLQVNPASHKVTTLATGFTLPNGIAQGREGDLLVSDSIPGQIFKVTRDGSTKSLWSADALLRSHHPFPIGANGIAFDRSQRFLYVSNTGDNRIIRIPVDEDGSAGTAEVFADGATLDSAQNTTNSLLSPDGIMFDVKGNLYICANAANEVQVLSPNGTRLVARYKGTGDNALDQAASLVFRNRTLYVTSLSLFDGGVNSKVSVLGVPFKGLPITFPDDESGDR